MPNQTKTLHDLTSLGTLSTQEVIVTDSAGKGYRTGIAALRTAILSGAPIYDNVFVLYHRNSDGLLMNVRPEEWPALESGSTHEVADGVLLAVGDKFLVVAPTEVSASAASGMLWEAESHSGSPIGGGTYYNSKALALPDWAGKSNTARIAAAFSGQPDTVNDNAALACLAYARTHAGTPENSTYGIAAGSWWLPSFGELWFIRQHYRAINFALSKITGATQLTNGAHWSSTEYSATLAWYLNFSYGNAGGYTNTTYRLRVRPVAAY